MVDEEQGWSYTSTEQTEIRFLPHSKGFTAFRTNPHHTML